MGLGDTLHHLHILIAIAERIRLLQGLSTHFYSDACSASYYKKRYKIQPTDKRYPEIS